MLPGRRKPAGSLNDRSCPSLQKKASSMTRPHAQLNLLEVVSQYEGLRSRRCKLMDINLWDVGNRLTTTLQPSWAKELSGLLSVCFSLPLRAIQALNLCFQLSSRADVYSETNPTRHF